MTKEMALGLFIKIHGHHIASWRHPMATENPLQLSYYEEIAKKAEAAKFDLLFLADHLDGLVHLESSFNYVSNLYLEPFVYLSALAANTRKIGLVGTVSTSFDEPFHVARRFNALDLVSNGRAGWNVVTSSTNNEAQNFHQERIQGADARYDCAEEFLSVAKKLWSSWEAEALILNQQQGVYADRSKVHEIQHKGTHFAVKGPLNLPASPQGHPVIVQAGSSPRGRSFAAKEAEVIFTAASTIEQAKAFYKDVKARVQAEGRSPEHVKVMPGLSVIVGKTKEEADAKERQLLDLIMPQAGISLIYNLTGVDLSDYPLDGPVPTITEKQGSAISSRFTLIKEVAERENFTIRQLYEYLSFGRGHFQIKGTPVEVADEMEKWMIENAADGFNILPPVLSEGVDDFIELVIPELQKRGLFKKDYTGNTLREHLQLPIPTNPFAKV